MRRVAVLEDDAVQRDALVSMIADHFSDIECEVIPCAQVEDVIASASPQSPLDILVTDIVLGDEAAPGEHPTSIDLVRTLQAHGSETQVVYVTGHADYHTSVYETDHACFLVKPFSREELDFALDRAVERLRKRLSAPLRIKCGADEVMVNPREIAYVESDRRKLRIHCGDEVLETYGKLGELEELLSSQFVRCHKSFLVNMSFIAAHRRDELRLTTGDVIPVSQSRRTRTQDAVRAFVRGL